MILRTEVKNKIMSIFLRPGQIKVRDDTGEFTSINVMAETSANEIINNIEAAGQEVIESIPADYTALTEEVDELNERIKNKKENVIAYVSGNAIEWEMTTTNCALKITGDIVVRDSAHAINSIILSVSDFLALASDSTAVSVSDGIVSGASFAFFYDYDSNSFKFDAFNTSAVYKNTIILFAHFYSSFTGGILVDSANNIEINKTVPYIDSQIDNVLTYAKSKKTNAISYVSYNAIEWHMTTLTNCALTISNPIIIRDRSHALTAIELSVSDFLTLAENSSVVTVSDGVVNGTAFAFFYDYETSSFQFGAFNNSTTFENSIILFAHYYASYTGGALIESANNIFLNDALSDIENLQEMVGGDGYAVPDYLKPVLETVVGTLETSCTEKTMLIAFTTDNHYGASNGANWPDTIGTIKAINSRYKLDAIIDGGDMINGEETADNARNRLAGMIADMNISNTLAYATVGNHDDDSFTVSQAVLLSQSQLYALVGRPFSRNYDNFNGTKTYGYKDFPMFGIRLIMMDSRIGDDRNGEDPLNWGYDATQIAWLRDVALDTDLQVAIFCHMGLTKEYSVANFQPVNGAEVRTILETFVSNGGTVIAWFHGHTHWDFIGQYTQVDGIHEVSTGCGRVQTFTPSYAPSGAVVPDRTSGTATQELYDIIAIKPDSRTVQMIRFGAGSNRSFTY